MTNITEIMDASDFILILTLVRGFIPYFKNLEIEFRFRIKK